MADVLLGRTEGFDGFERHVVLKRIRSEHANDQRFIRMFLDEARVAANLHHQHIVQVHDVGESSGEYFIAMEYLHGEDVRTILSTASKARQHVPLGYAIAIVSAAAAGLHYAHERRGPDKRSLGIVHRDISPSNILVGYDGSVKVVDFGIAKASMRKETRSSSLKGKISYMSPEQCKGAEADRRSDVYSLGVVLYELCTTTRLFKGESDYLVMDQIVNGRVSLPQVRRPELPNELSTIIMRAIAPDPEHRYATADELRLALDQFANRVGLVASTSAIASYMRKQFGERPEPWVEHSGQLLISLPGGAREPMRPSSSWTEQSVSVPMPRGSDPILPSHEPAAAITGDVVPIATPPPTESKMGWESQRPPAPRGLAPARSAMIAAPVIAVLGLAIWWFVDAGPAGTEAEVTARSAAAVAPPVSGGTVTPLPEGAPPPVEASRPAPASAPARAPDPASTPAPPALSATDSASRATPRVRAPETPSVTSSRPSVAPSHKPSTAKVVEAPAPPSHRGSEPLAAAVAAAAPAPAAASPAPATPLSPAVVPAAAPSLPPGPPVPVPSVPAAPPSVAPPAPVDAGPPPLSYALIDRVASEHTRELSKCDGGEQLRGEIVVRFTVDPRGKVTKAQLATSLKRPKVAACILRQVQSWQFARQPAGAQGTYTLSFQ